MLNKPDPPETKPSDKLAVLVDKNLILSKATSNGVKCYFKQNQSQEELFADPVGMLMQERIKNCGQFNVPKVDLKKMGNKM
jgi:hypothetical protein